MFICLFGLLKGKFIGKTVTSPILLFLSLYHVEALPVSKKPAISPGFFTIPPEKGKISDNWFPVHSTKLDDPATMLQRKFFGDPGKHT